MNRERTPPLSVCLFAVVALLVLIACSGSGGLKDTIIGKWESLQPGAEIAFFKDGTVSIAGPNATRTGDYSIIDETHVRIDFKADPQAGSSDQTGLYDVQLAGDQLTLTAQGSVPLVFKRSS